MPAVEYLGRAATWHEPLGTEKNCTILLNETSKSMYQFTKRLQLLGDAVPLPRPPGSVALPPDPLTRGSALGHRWGLSH